MKANDAEMGMQSFDVISRKRWFAVCAAVLMMTAALVSQSVPGANQRANRITQEITSGAMVTVTGTVHPLTKRATDLGAVNSEMQLDSMTLNIALSAAQQTELDALLAAQQNPKSPQYHQWLTQEEYGARFGLTDSDLNKVTGWLTAQGFTVKSVSASRNAITFGGKAWQVESAFHTQLHQYKLDGQMHFANASELKVPAGLASVLLNVRGLNNFRPKPLTKIKVEPQYTLDPTDHFLTPGDWATIYDVTAIYNAGYDGTGAHVGVMGQTYVPQADIDHFRSASGLSATKLTPYCISTANCTGAAGTSTTGDLGEADLDIEWAGGIAKNATVDYIYASAADTTLGVYDALQYAVQTYKSSSGTRLPVISVSYTGCEADNTLAEANVLSSIGEQANSQGQTIVVASGDSGAAGCDYQGETSDYPAQYGASVSVPPDSPYFTGVGGTTLNGDESNYGLYWNQTAGTVSSALSYIPETVWNDTSATNGLLASAGGVSLYFPQPSWQPTPTNYTGVSGRFVPDVSFAASPMHDGYMNCSQDNNSTQYGTMCANGFFSSGTGQNSVFFVAGGTSASAPSFAGMLTLLAQKYGNLGNVNPTLYNLALSHPSVFHDTTSGNNIVPCTVIATDPGCTTGDFGWYAQTGYDLATGLGSVDGYQLYTNWQNTSAGAATSTTIAASPSSLKMYGTTVLTATVTSGTAGTISGNVDFQVGDVVLGTAQVSGGVATLSVVTSAANGFGVGTNTISATYDGNANFAASTPGTTTITLAALPATATTVTATPNSVTFGSTTTLSATVTSGTAGTITGTVTFSVGGAPVGTVTLSNGTAALSNPVTVSAANGFTTGSNTITASYSGDTNYAPSNGGTALTVTGAAPSYTLSASPTTTAIAAGSTGTVTLTLTPTNYTGMITLNAICSTPSAISAIGYSPYPISMASGAAQPVTLTITTSASAANHAPAVPWKSSGEVMFCAVLLGAPFTRKRKRALAVLLIALAVVGGGFLISCGGGGSSTPVKAARTYYLTVTPTGTGTVTNAKPIMVTVTVQ
jgi:hypothetical protein